MNNFRQELIKKILIALLALIIPIGTLFFLIWDINHRTEATAEKRQKLADHSEKLSLYAKLQNQFLEADSYTSILKNVLPGRDQLLDFQKEMKRLASQEGVNFGFSFGNETPPSSGTAGRMAFDIVTGGPFYKIFSFIKIIEESRFLIDFKSFNFAGSTANIAGEVLFY